MPASSGSTAASPGRDAPQNRPVGLAHGAASTQRSCMTHSLAGHLLALTRDISPAIEHCELTHLERTTIDLGRARSEHAAYEAALRALGCEVKRLPTADDLPDSVFIEDA